jgi:predicted dehydrogenase
MTIKKVKESANDNISRRQFIGRSAAAAAGVMIVPRAVLGGPGYIPPSDKVNIACIGVGGMGHNDTKGVATENIVALCDVDEDRAAKSFKMFPKAKQYKDFRVMLDEMDSDIDAVTVSTPDHSHAVIAAMAMKMGKHAYVQKPLTHDIYEARMLAKISRDEKVKTQMGNQGHAGEGGRLINEWIWDGAIGAVREVHCWTNRPVWPQGIDRPMQTPSKPPTMAWDLWLGTAPWRYYHPGYAPFNWRGWWDFGTGVMGDMGAHIIDHPFWALKLHHPESVQATSTKIFDETYPLASIITMNFGAREGMAPVTMKWFDGGLLPPRPDDLEQGRMMGNRGGGVIFYGDKGKLMCSVYGENPRLIPETNMKEYKKPEKTIPRSPGIREEWIEAIKNDGETTSNFEYAGLLTESMLLGNIALKYGAKNKIFEWDYDNMKITNDEEANAMVRREYRKGWSL